MFIQYKNIWENESSRKIDKVPVFTNQMNKKFYRGLNFCSLLSQFEKEENKIYYYLQKAYLYYLTQN